MHAGAWSSRRRSSPSSRRSTADDKARQRRHAVRQGRRRGRGPREVRLPRPAHAHGHRPRGEAHQRAPRRERRGAARHRALPLDDAATYELMQRRDHRGVPARIARHEGPVRRLQPDRFEDIVALVALFRPGPLESGMVGRLHRRASTAATTHAPPIDYLHPRWSRSLEPTYGVILYQEQVMQIAQVLAGYSLGGADLLRRAMGKKKPEEMAKQRASSSTGAVKNSVPERAGRVDLRPDGEVRRVRLQQVALGGLRAVVVPDRVAEGALPGGFMAAVLSADMDNTDKVVGDP